MSDCKTGPFVGQKGEVGDTHHGCAEAVQDVERVGQKPSMAVNEALISEHVARKEKTTVKCTRRSPLIGCIEPWTQGTIRGIQNQGRAPLVRGWDGSEKSLFESLPFFFLKI